MISSLSGSGQKIPEPTVHLILRPVAHFANLKQMRSIAFQKSGGPDELERGSVHRAAD